MREIAARETARGASGRHEPVALGKPPCVALLSSSIDMSYLVPAFRRLDPEIDLRWGANLGSLTDIEAAVCWRPARGLLRQLPNLQLIQSSGAGVDHLLDDPDLPDDVPLCRAIDPSMAAGMAAYVCWAVIHHQRNMKDYLGNAIVHAWFERPVTLPSSHVVGIAGMGELGRASARALTTIGYNVRGWSRTPPSEPIEGVDYFSGESELRSFLRVCDTLVCLLPLTNETRGFLGGKLFSALKHGAHIVNVGRGEHLVESELLDALANGSIGAATLDTFRHEPLPASSALWSNSRVCITPHIASRCDPLVLARQTIDRLNSIRTGAPTNGLVDRNAGY
ncbi:MULTISPECIES: 2-hydroxyacid dehydrogenase [Paraburkholderia]|uniref:D-isomer specific 2-hydroxyacid dehydrogenase NAD-binding n=3 Tax=Paraburkholderia TaxID=1822464 RepID=B2JRL9_PARP8|nr:MULTISPECIES: glyoxylate/hydroxypyruvate reductase A [Paraburkholderia]ACC72346.1 D-isomer specific 2-hydroxyacid dehydrogenase NAD-binding [Paraburkholderia phymatum STM815]AFT86240.1 Glyoxylate/hydroxypyruvate reductase A [Paraburkholderia phenoliruptrix BR3459a]